MIKLFLIKKLLVTIKLSFTHPISESYDLKYNLNAGDIIVFPSNFLYPHSILPITLGVRYSIIIWAN